MDWRTLAVAAIVIHRTAILTKSHLFLDIAKVNLTNVLEMAILRGMFQRFRAGKVSPSTEKGLRMETLVKKYSTWDASDARDKIYALSGLAISGGSDVAIDYDRSIEDVYEAFASAAIKLCHALDVNTIVSRVSEATNQLPSWVLDCRSASLQLDLGLDVGCALCLDKRTSTGRSFAASGEGIPDTMPLIIANRKVTAKGLQLGTVVELGNVIQSSKEDLQAYGVYFRYRFWGPDGDENNCEIPKGLLSWLLKMIKTLKGWSSIAHVHEKSLSRTSKQGKTYWTGEQMRDVYRRLLNLDLVPKDCSQSLVDAAFQKWVACMHMIAQALEGMTSSGNDFDTGTVWEPYHLLRVVERLEKELHRGSRRRWAAVRLAYKEGHLTKLLSTARALYKSSKAGLGFVVKQGGLSLFLRNSLAVNLENINQRRLARTDNGLLAMAPAGTQVGDRVLLLEGGSVPFVARLRTDVWEMVGSAYVHGAMYGEMWDREMCVDVTFA